MSVTARPNAAGTGGRWRGVARAVLAGPVAAALSLLVLAAMPLWMPPGAAGVDHLVLPLVLAPAIWAVLMFYALLDRSLARVAVVTVLLGGLNAALLVRQLASMAPASPPRQERTP